MPTLLRDDGATLHVEVAGAGPPLLMLHGWSRSSLDLAGLAARLAPRHRVLSLDLRGHGRSTSGPFTLAALAGDVAALAGAEALHGALLLGWSLGGQVALAAAALPALRARLAGLVLVGATPRFTEGDGWPHGLPARAVEGLALRVRRQPAKALTRFLEDCLAPGEAEALGEGRLAALRGGPAPDAAAALAGLDLLASTDLRGALPAVTLPTLVLHGEADAICPVGAGRALAAALPAARLRTVPGAGHAPFLAQEALVAEAVLAFAGGPL
ncbi:MAG: alpha/beta fold hydrolase [Anaeromyxobacter sp.]|nr:alpha/beta fold hydrolase [Anaeromyxobacter sp.]MBL0275688.1 alpha/beta fold hydrolase [Anaeromyxobacter sp.]